MEPQNDMHRLVQSPPEQPSRTAGSQPRLELHGILEGQTGLGLLLEERLSSSTKRVWLRETMASGTFAKERH
ncbi:hypothetical protein SCLCIDRAFT_1223987 [Scleroderma citrinum Foug A]|uniref:Uncharacterized protein n=1 Tax=Scleroderma citrinum Foug A TaxID=1036808 RepID=A0A0C3D7V9_9AGAM|nr:hypothetical protein SCLCIDRAFT_1223987 [Scleroderma citrinum Foug A]